MNNYIQFIKTDKNLSADVEIKCLHALRESQYFVDTLRSNGEYWLIYSNSINIGIFGFYKRMGIKNFVWTIFSEFRGGNGRLIFNEIFRYFGCQKFCISTINAKEFHAAIKIYRRYDFKYYRIGAKFLFVNGTHLFYLWVVFLTHLKNMRKSLK